MTPYIVASLNISAWLGMHGINPIKTEKTASGRIVWTFNDNGELHNCLDAFTRRETEAARIVAKFLTVRKNVLEVPLAADAV